MCDATDINKLRQQWLTEYTEQRRCYFLTKDSKRDEEELTQLEFTILKVVDLITAKRLAIFPNILGVINKVTKNNHQVKYISGALDYLINKYYIGATLQGALETFQLTALGIATVRWFHKR